MSVLYVECNMGIAGDMFLSALVDLTEDKEKTVAKLNAIGIPGVEYVLEDSVKCGIHGSHVRVLVGGVEETSDMHTHAHNHGHGRCDCEPDPHHHGPNPHEHEHDSHDHVHDPHDPGHGHQDHGHDMPHHGQSHHDHVHHHSHAGMKEIEAVINGLSVKDSVKEHALAVYKRIAKAESTVHHSTVTEIHFHEVGTKDAIADIVGTAFLIEELAPEKILFSPIATGYGSVRCAHGILPVPAPATALLLTGIPSFAGEEAGEHATPTGVALAGHYAQGFGQRPLMAIRKIGYGMGTKDFKAANCVRLYLGDELTESI